jgi:hypothetical protein
LGPIATGNSATNPQAQSAATLVANSAAASPLGQSAATLVANSIAANTADIIQMGNVIANYPPIPKRAATTHHTVFNMRHAIILSDTVDAKPSERPSFRGILVSTFSENSITPDKKRLMDEICRTLVPENEITIWPRRRTASPGEALEFSMITIAETIVKIYAPETAPHVKSIDQRCREAPFKYKMKDQNIEEHFIVPYLQLIEDRFLGETLSEEDDDMLTKIFDKKLPRNIQMAKLHVASTRAELDGGLDTVEKAVLRVKKLLTVVRQAIRLANSYGPEEYVFRIESKDKEIPSSPTPYNNQNRSSNDTTNTQNDNRFARQ